MKSQFSLTEEQEMFRKTIRRLSEEKIAPKTAEMDETGEFSIELLSLFREYQLLGLTFPEKYGGGGGDEVSFCVAAEEISRIDASSAMWCGLSHLGAQPIVTGGSEEQKQRFMPSICTGEKLCAFGLTEPGGGSDVAGLKTRAVKEGNYYVINGTKCFITCGNVAHYVSVFAKTEPSAGHKGVSVFVVEKDTPGFQIGKLEKKMGVHASPTAELIFENCKVPVENRLGSEGDGFKLAMTTLDITRPGVGAMAIGIAQGAFENAKDYAIQRIQFGRPIAEFQAIQFMLADMATEIEAARLLVWRAAAAVDEMSPQMTLLGSMAKYFASDVAMKVTTDAVQILGGYGYMKDYPLERFMRDAKHSQIVEGTNQIQRIVVARELLKRAKSSLGH